MGKDLGISVAENIGLSESVGPRPAPTPATVFNVVEVYYEDKDRRELVRRMRLDKNHFVAPGQMREILVKVMGR